jgi:hypothetical protein
VAHPDQRQRACDGDAEFLRELAREAIDRALAGEQLATREFPQAAVGDVRRSPAQEQRAVGAADRAGGDAQPARRGRGAGQPLSCGIRR